MEHGILSGKKIAEEIDAGRILVSPFNRKNINPASIDLTLGKKVSVYKSVTSGCWKRYGDDGIAGDGILQSSTLCLDAKIQHEVSEYELADGEAIFLKPGIGYLMHTAERVWTESYVPVLDGKSSIGRLFTQIHVTAGYGDPGFNGQYTLEVVVTHPVTLYAGMRISQMRFHTICGDHTSYQDTGNYKGELAEGPIPSQSYRMFRL